MIKRLTNRERVILFVCITLACVYVGYNGLINPLKKRIGSVDEDIFKNRRLLNKSFVAIEKSKKLEEQYSDYLNRFKQFKSDEQVMASILSEIEETANEFGLEISDLKPKKVKSDEHYNRFSVSLTIRSEMIGVLRFLHILQGQPHFFNFEEARFENSSRRRTSGITTRLVLSKTLIP